MHKNREIIGKAVNKVDMGQGTLSVGCYDDTLNKLSQVQLKKVLEAIDLGDTTDVDVKIGRAFYVVEIGMLGQEMDFNILTKEEYISRYGGERYGEEF